MEVLILDSLLRPVEVVDTFISVVWAERFSVKGDCEIVTLSTPANKKRFTKNVRFMINESKRIMQIDIVEEKIDEEQRMVLNIKALELVDILDRRAAVKAVAGPGIAPVWYIEAMTPGNVMRHIFEQICVTGTVSADDIIPFVEPGNLYPADTIPEPADLINWEQKPASVYAAEVELSDIYDLGFRLYKDPNLSKLYFNVYAGSDRTTAQSVLPPVVFSQEMENLQNTSEYNDVRTYFNVVRVMYTYTDDVTELDVTLSLEVTDNPTDPPQGFDRKVKVLVVSSVPEEVTDIPAFLVAAGIDELMKSRPLGAFDGEVSANTQYVYERDYYLGDLVEIRGISGASAYMRIEEYIFVEDAQGQRSYPTFTTKKFIEPGVWDSYIYDVNWDDFPDTETWDNQP